MTARRSAFGCNESIPGGNGDARKFQKNFPASLFENFTWYGGQIRNNANGDQLISAEGLDFLILHLECNAPDDVLMSATRPCRQPG